MKHQFMSVTFLFTQESNTKNVPVSRALRQAQGALRASNQPEFYKLDPALKGALSDSVKFCSANSPVLGTGTMGTILKDFICNFYPWSGKRKKEMIYYMVSGKKAGSRGYRDYCELSNSSG
jgi:hypothetical protein